MNGDCFNHLTKLKQFLIKLQEKELKFNIENILFAQSELEYFGLWVTLEDVRPTAKQIEAIVYMNPPKNSKTFCRFIGMISYYRDIWVRMPRTLQYFMKFISA